MNSQYGAKHVYDVIPEPQIPGLVGHHFVGHFSQVFVSYNDP